MSIEYIFFAFFALNLNCSEAFQVSVIVFSISGFHVFMSLNCISFVSDMLRDRIEGILKIRVLGVLWLRR